MFGVIYSSSPGKLLCVWLNKDSLNNNYIRAVNKSLRISLLPSRSLHKCSESDMEKGPLWYSVKSSVKCIQKDINNGNAGKIPLFLSNVNVR